MLLHGEPGVTDTDNHAIRVATMEDAIIKVMGNKKGRVCGRGGGGALQ